MSKTDPTQLNYSGSWGKMIGIVTGVACALSLLVLSFVWPGARSEADGLAIAVTGDEQLVTAFLAGAEEGLDEVVDLVEVSDRAVAVSAIADREVIGALVLTQDAPEVLTATANGQVPAAFMTEVAAQLQATLDTQIYGGVLGGVHAAFSALTAPGGPPGDAAGPNPADMLAQFPQELPQVTVTDVVPTSEGDPNGVGATTAGIPLTVGALLSGLVIAFTVRGASRRVSAVLGLGVGGGLLLTLVLHTWLEVFPGSFGSLWLALGLSLTATSGLFVGLHSVLGRGGIAIAAALTLFAAMPWAAFAVPSGFLPGGLGALGQGMIPGATATLTRLVGYFPDAGAAGPWWVLSIWAIVGIALACITRRAPGTRRTGGAESAQATIAG